MNVLALDLGTRTGWALAEHGRVESGVQVFDVKRGESPGMRYRRFMLWLTDLMARSTGGDDTELRAWAAGFFDGEGYIGCSSNGRRHVRQDGTESVYDTKALQVGINQAGSPEVLDKFRSAVGNVGVVNGPYIDKRFEDARQYWHYAASGLDNCRQIIAAIWPWLGTTKRAQAEAALNEKLVNIKRPLPSRPDWTIVYEQTHHRGGAATEVAAGFATRVQEFCAREGIEHAAVHSAALKKFACGKGNAKKPDMLRAVVERGWWAASEMVTRAPQDDDEVDAVCLLHYALAEIVPTRTAGA